MKRALLVLTGLFLAASPGLAAPTKVSFWHYLSDAKSSKAIEQFANDFNKSQEKYQVQTVPAGDYKTLNVKLIAALRGGGLPTMALTDNAFFTRLAVGGQLAPLDDLVADLDKETVKDFYPVLWEYGVANSKRYGLPWAASTLLLYYNTELLKARNVQPPRTWQDFATAAKTLTTRASKGAVIIADAWIFGSIVLSRGGSLLDKDDRPSLESPETLASLEFLQGTVRDGSTIARSTNELSVAVLDFIRTKAAMVIAPSSAYTLASDLAVGFKPGVVALPGRTIAGEAQIVVLKGAKDAERDGAFAFWKYLTEPKNITKWTALTGYLPVRRSAAADPAAFGDKATVVKAGMAALENAVNLPRLAAFDDWRTVLETALERSLKGNVDARVALGEAQRKTLAQLPAKGN